MGVDADKDGQTGVDAHLEKQDPTVELTTQTHRALSAFVVPGGDPTAELQKLDKLFKEAGDAAKPFVDLTARRLFQQTEVFDNLNFQSSLLTNGSKFFGAVLERMGNLVDEDQKLAEGAKLPVLIRLVEHYRRGEIYEKMTGFVAKVNAELGVRVAANDPLACNQMAKVEYERHMAAYQQGGAAEKGEQPDVAAARAHYEQSMVLAEQSADLARRGNDRIGPLFTAMNVSGLLLPKLGRVDESFALSDATYVEASAIAETLPDGSGDKSRAQRVIMNTLLHRLELGVPQKRPVAEMHAWLSTLEPNPVYIGAREHDHVKKIVDEARVYIDAEAA